MANDLSRRAIAEALGTFSLVAVGCGAIVVNQLTSDLGHLGVAAAFGLVVMVMVAATNTLLFQKETSVGTTKSSKWNRFQAGYTIQQTENKCQVFSSNRHGCSKVKIKG